MSVNSILNPGIQGVQSATQGVERVAKDIVRSGADGAAGQNNVVESIVDLQLYERSVQASAQIVKTADEVLGTILDTMV